MDRRNVLYLLAGGALSPFAQTESDGMIYRPLGRTGERVSAIGLGGYHLGHPKDPNDAIRIVRSALDRGITFLDNCWDYNEGESERRMGLALRDDYRSKAFLMTKFDGRTKTATVSQIDESLRRLETDHIDLIQYHENIRMEDPDRFFAANGPLEALMEAKKAGKIRYIGFTGHKDPAVHLRMLEIAKVHGFHFDTCQMPLNVMDAHFRSFEHQVLPKLLDQGIAPLAMKSMGDGHVLKSGKVTAVECLRYSLSLPVSVVITGCEHMEILDQAIDVARSFKPLSGAQKTALLARTQGAAMTGDYEPFKTSSMFDGTAQHPAWLG
jgi:aryl-alcohol dehydrogenase-like predicted oxidoreductase